MIRRAMLLATLAAISGCGSKTATVHGRVTFADRPVAVGTLTLVREDGWTSGPIALDDDGRFVVNSVPIGTVTAIVSTPPAHFFSAELTEASKKTDPEVIAREAFAKKYISIPPQYDDPKTSGLVYQLQAGENILEIALP